MTAWPRNQVHSVRSNTTPMVSTADTALGEVLPRQRSLQSKCQDALPTTQSLEIDWCGRHNAQHYEQALLETCLQIQEMPAEHAQKLVEANLPLVLQIIVLRNDRVQPRCHTIALPGLQ